MRKGQHSGNMSLASQVSQDVWGTKGKEMLGAHPKCEQSSQGSLPLSQGRCSDITELHAQKMATELSCPNISFKWQLWWGFTSKEMGSHSSFERLSIHFSKSEYSYMPGSPWGFWNPWLMSEWEPAELARVPASPNPVSDGAATDNEFLSP